MSDLAREVLKDPYTFDFLSLGEEAHERDLERGLVENVQKLLLEMGAARLGVPVDQLAVNDAVITAKADATKRDCFYAHAATHLIADRDGDPHSPMVSGIYYAHVGWLFTYSGTDTAKYAPDLIADRAIDRISRLWPLIAVISMVVPGGGAWPQHRQESRLGRCPRARRRCDPARASR